MYNLVYDQCWYSIYQPVCLGCSFNSCILAISFHWSTCP